MVLATVDFTPRIGSEIRIDAEWLLSGAFAAEIRSLHRVTLEGEEALAEAAA